MCFWHNFSFSNCFAKPLFLAYKVSAFVKVNINEGKDGEEPFWMFGVISSVDLDNSCCDVIIIEAFKLNMEPLVNALPFSSAYVCDSSSNLSFSFIQKCSLKL